MMRSTRLRPSSTAGFALMTTGMMMRMATMTGMMITTTTKGDDNVEVVKGDKKR